MAESTVLYRFALKSNECEPKKSRVRWSVGAKAMNVSSGKKKRPGGQGQIDRQREALEDRAQFASAVGHGE